MTNRGSYVHKLMVGFSAASQFVFAYFSKYWWFHTKQFTGLSEFRKLYKQNPLEKLFIFTIIPKLYFGFNKYIYVGLTWDHHRALRPLRRWCPEGTGGHSLTTPPWPAHGWRGSGRGNQRPLGTRWPGGDSWLVAHPGSRRRQKENTRYFIG